MSLGESVEKELGVERRQKGALGKVRGKRPPRPPSSEDPRTELRRLVKEHRILTSKAVAIVSMASDRVVREDRKDATGNVFMKKGDIMPCFVPSDIQADMKGTSSALRKAAAKAESAMLRELRKLPVYEHFLKRVYGLGPVVSAYLLAYVDFQKAVKISNLRRFCGLAIIDGRLERPTRGQTLGYCAELRTRLFQAMSAMWKNAVKTGVTTKYLEVWRGYKNRMQHSERLVEAKIAADGLVDGKIVNGQGKETSARRFIHATGWHKAADVLVEDLYIVGRAAEGLPVWPSYYAAKLGYQHGGAICVNAPRMLTIEEAIELVGDVGKRPTSSPPEDIDLGDEEDAHAATSQWERAR